MIALKIFKVWQNKNTGYDKYNSFVVVAENAEQARKFAPDGYHVDSKGVPWYEQDYLVVFGNWAIKLDDVLVKEIGIVTDDSLKAGDVIVASFNAE